MRLYFLVLLELPMKKPIAIRILTQTGSAKRRFRVELMAPVKRGRAWHCHFRIKGGKKLIEGDSVGEDSMQAILIAFEGIRSKFEQAELHGSWLTGDDGDIGIPRLAPMAFGYRVQRAVEHAMERKLKSLVMRSK